MKRIYVIAGILMIAASLSAAHYPDSVRQQSRQEPNIAYGWNFEFGGGLGVGSYTYSQLGASFQPAHVVNKIHFPAWHAELGISYYFVSWMGIGTGAQFSAYPNCASIAKPWTQQTVDAYNDDYTITTEPYKLNEYQNIYMVEIPFALKFRARPGKVGFTGTAGVKLGLPLINSQRLASGGTMNNSVYYPLYDLTMHDVPTVVENLPVSSDKRELPSRYLRSLNWAAYAELGMLIRLHQRVDLAIAAYANYYFTDLLDRHGSMDLGFYDGRTTGEYPLPYTQAYEGVLQTNEVETLHPWSVGLKIGIQVNANRTKAQRDYDREQRRKRLEAQQTQPDTTAIAVAVQPEVVVDQPDEFPSIMDELDAEREAYEQAIEQIRQIAEANGIDICDVFCTDTLYREAQETVEMPQTATAAELLDEHLKESVIYFDLDKAIPILEPADILERIAAILRQHPNQKIHVNGHACKLGKPDYNKRLALRRANAVADQLRALGVKDNQMLIASLGDDVPYRYTGEHQLSKDRRVELVPCRATTEVVKPGSRLAQISRRHYGQTEFWVFIYEANRDKIEDPGNLPVGIELEIPDLSVRLIKMNETEALEEAQRVKERLIPAK
jgi:outer membrane protein OmpA-like peptidoglycan-associated protein/phage tail protein X